MDLTTPDLARFELFESLARGATGTVYRGRDRETGEPCAVKVVDPELAGGPRYATILQAEAPAAVAFRHPAASRTLFAGRLADRVVIAIEMLSGQTLEALVQRAAAAPRPPPWEVMCWVALQIVDVLRSAHATPWAEGEQKGMYHCSVSPQSILLLPNGGVKLLGVGLGRSRMCLPPSREKLPYRAPELFERQKPDELTDIYSLGVTLYDAIAGWRFYGRDNVADIRSAILEETPPSLRMERPEVDPAIDQLILEMMSKFPRTRPSLRVVEETLRGLSRRSSFSSAGVAEALASLFADMGAPSEKTNGRSASTAPQVAGFYPEYSIDDLVERLVQSRQEAPEVEPRELDEPPPEPLRTADLLPNVRAVEPSDELEAPSGVALTSFDEESDNPFDVDAIVNAIVSGAEVRSEAAPPPSPAPEPAEPPQPLTTADLTDEQLYAEKLSALDDPDDAFDVEAIVNAIVSTTQDIKATPRQGPPQDSSPASRGLPVSRKPAARPSDDREVTPPEVASTADVLQASDPGLKPGDVIGDRYRVLDELGEGGMSVVYRVEHTLLLKKMALKLLRPELSSMPSVVERFQLEARSVCQLDDPNIVRVTDFGRQPSGSLYLVMDYLEGESLAARLRREGQLDVRETVDVVAQILSGLAHAHRAGVVHRDLKPENIMLVPKYERIQVKILDFGIAKLAHRDDEGSAKPITQAGTVFGTPRYMSPEQASAEPVDMRADLYAVGVILYECLCGEPPFDGSSAVKILSKVLTEDPPPLRLQEPTPQEGQALEAVVMKALEKEKEDRFSSALVFREALLSAIGR